MRIIIDHEKYGELSEFKTLEEAQAAIRACGPEFKRTRLQIMGDTRIMDEEGDYVGSVEE